MIRDGHQQLRAHWGRHFAALSPESKEALRAALLELRSFALRTAEHQWKKHKAPMALYWKVIGVYSGHLARCIK